MKFRVDSDKLNRAAKFLRTYIHDKFPNLNVSILSALYDLVLKPSAKIYVYMEETMDTVRNSLFRSKFKDIADEETRKAAYDNFASNYFITRNKGKKAVAELVVTVGTLKTYTIPGNTRFNTGGLNFFPYGGATQVIRHSSIAEVSDGAGGKAYEFAMLVEAESEGAHYNVDANTEWDTNLVESAIVRIVNPSPIDSGVDEESNQALDERIENSMTIRNMVNDRSIGFQLRGQFPQIIKYVAVGHLERELFREVILVNVVDDLDPVYVRIGGKVDLYVYTGIRQNFKVEQNNRIKIWKVDDEYKVRLMLPDTIIFFELRDIQIDNKSMLEALGREDIGYIGREQVQSDESLYRMTLKEKPYIELTPENLVEYFELFADTTELEIAYDNFLAEEHPDFVVGDDMVYPEMILPDAVDFFVDYAPSVDEITSFVNSFDQGHRVILADYLVRGMIPCYLSFHTVVYAQPNALISVTEIENFIREYITTSMDPVFNMGSLIDQLKSNFPIDRVKLPVAIDYRMYSIRNTLHQDVVIDEVNQQIIDLDAAFQSEDNPEIGSWVSRRLVKLIPDKITVGVE